MTNYEKLIKAVKEIGSQKLMESAFSLKDFAVLVECLCNDYGKEKVYADLGLTVA